jgi:hypothetical protein
MRLVSCVIVVALVGCSTEYIPRTPGRVAVTMRDGKFVYARDGQSFEHGLLGGGLVDAVQGNPAAMIAANEYHGRIKTGFIAAMLGLATMTAGTFVTVDGAVSEQNNRAATGAAVMLAGVALALGGAFYAVSAEPYRWDAINIYNDGPPPYQPPPMPSAPPGWSASSAPKATLEMRGDR